MVLAEGGLFGRMRREGLKKGLRCGEKKDGRERVEMLVTSTFGMRKTAPKQRSGQKSLSYSPKFLT